MFGRSVKNFRRAGTIFKGLEKIRNVREKMYGKNFGKNVWKKSRGSKILATRGRDFVKFYLASPKMRVAPQMPP